MIYCRRAITGAPGSGWAVIANADGTRSHYGVVHLPWGAGLMVIARLMSGLLGIGARAVKVAAMDYVMRLPLKVSSATSNFMIGVTAGAGALVFLARDDISPPSPHPLPSGSPPVSGWQPYSASQANVRA